MLAKWIEMLLRLFDIDAAYVWGPFSQQLESDGGKEIFATRDLQKDGVLIFNNFAGRKEFAEKYPDLVVKFLRVVQDKVDQYKGGKEALFGFFVGQTMKAMAGKANPKVVNELLKKALS